MKKQKAPTSFFFLNSSHFSFIHSNMYFFGPAPRVIPEQATHNPSPRAPLSTLTLAAPPPELPSAQPEGLARRVVAGLHPPPPFSRGERRWRGPFFVLLRTATAAAKWWRRSGPSLLAAGGVWQCRRCGEVRSCRVAVDWRRPPVGWQHLLSMEGSGGYG
jgi:hypothetical protein